MSGQGGGGSALLHGGPTLAAPPPTTNRGVEITKRGPVVGFHTLGFTIQAPPDYVRQIAAWLLHPGLEEQVTWQSIGHGGRAFKEIEVGPLGAKIYHTPTNGQEYCSLELPGSAVECIDPNHLHEWCKSLEEAKIGWWTSRCDVFADYCPFQPKQLYRALQRGDIRTSVKYQGNSKSWGWHQNGEGTTFTLGARPSERYFRCYDARGYTRTEMEFKGNRGRLVGKLILLSPPQEWPKLFLSHLRQFVDFVDKSAEKNISRAPLLSWWDEFVGSIPKAQLYLAQVHKTLEKVKSWLHKQVAASVAMIEKAEPLDFGDFLVNLLDTGRMKLGPRHHLLLAIHARTAPIPTG